MDNRAATVVLIVGLSFVFWLHNTERLRPIIDTIKAPSGGGGKNTAATAPVDVFTLPPSAFLPGTGFSGFPGSINK